MLISVHYTACPKYRDGRNCGERTKAAVLRVISLIGQLQLARPLFALFPTFLSIPTFRPGACTVTAEGVWYLCTLGAERPSGAVRIRPFPQVFHALQYFLVDWISYFKTGPARPVLIVEYIKLGTRHHAPQSLSH